MMDHVPAFPMKGHITIFEEAHPEHVLFEEHNIIVNTVKSLFARLMAASTEPRFGVWGLAIGAGHASWTDPSAQPDATAVQTALFDEIRRKKCSAIRFLNNATDRTPLAAGQFSETVDFQTILNATTDNITRSIREMGLLGGGSSAQGTDMSNPSTLWWDPATKDPNSTTLINYKTLPALDLPPGINFVCSWVLTF